VKCQLCDVRTLFDDGICDRHAHLSLLQMRETVGEQKATIERLTAENHQMEKNCKVILAADYELRVTIERLTADLDACREKLRIAVDDADGTHAESAAEIERLRAELDAAREVLGESIAVNNKLTKELALLKAAAGAKEKP